MGGGGIKVEKHEIVSKIQMNITNWGINFSSYRVFKLRYLFDIPDKFFISK